MDFERLRRWPDAEGEGLRAWDAADALVLDEAAPWLAGVPGEAVVTLDDAYGALTIGAAEAAGAGVRAHTDAITGERAIRNNAERAGASGIRTLPLGPEALADARVVLMRLPRSLDRLDELAGLVARHAEPEVVVVAGGRLKHMTTAMNEVFARHFGRLDVSLARQKSRVLIAREPAPGPETWPKRRRDEALGLEVVAHGGVFAGTSVDIGTRFLLEHLPQATDAGIAPGPAVDLACGTGVVAAWLARRGLDVVAGDRSASAVASARATAAANGVDVDVHQADGLEFLPDASAGLIALNPPFHAGAAVSEAIAEHLFAGAARALAPGAELWCVWNSHLRYRARLERVVGPTRQIARNAKFTVTASQRG